MKLQKQLNRRDGGRVYTKWVLVVPPRIVGDLGWKEGQEFKVQVDGRSIRIRPFSRSPL